MAAIDFPNSPSVGQIFEDPNGATWQYNGSAWLLLSISPDIWLSANSGQIGTLAGGSGERMLLFAGTGASFTAFGRSHASFPGYATATAASGAGSSLLTCTPAGALTWATPIGTVLQVDATTGNLGIHATPIAPLTAQQTTGGGAPSLSNDNTTVGTFFSNTSNQLSIGGYSGSPFALWLQGKQTTNSGSSFPIVLNPLGGNVGIGLNNPSAQLELSLDSAKKPTTNTWTISSDERLKENIGLADLQRCYDIVKGLPLKRFTWREAVYPLDRVNDRSKLGWIAQDVRAIFPKAVEISRVDLVPVDDGTEDVLEQETAEEVRTRIEISIEDGIPVRRTITETVHVPQFDHLPVVDENGTPVSVPRAILDEDGRPAIELVQLTHAVPRMHTARRAKQRIDSIDDCLALNSDQIYAALYGAVQALIAKVESLAPLEGRVERLEDRALEIDPRPERRGST
jgi:hypothetical protein